LNEVDIKFEQLADKLAIPKREKKKCRNVVNKLFNELNRTSYRDEYSLQNPFKNYKIGGSFDRHTVINREFDIDVYFIFNDHSEISMNYHSSVFFYTLEFNVIRLGPDTLQDNLFIRKKNVKYLYK